MKKSRCFSYKKKKYTTYDCLKKRKIAIIIENISKNNNN